LPLVVPLERVQPFRAAFMAHDQRTEAGARLDTPNEALDDARASLRATEEHFRLLVESVRDYAIFLLDPKGRVASWNAGAERIKGYLAAEILGRHFSVFYPEEDVRGGKCEMELEVAGREGRFEDEGWRVRKDGARFWANVVITALRDRSGRLIGFAKVTRDLTERRQAEEERVRLIAEQKAREAADAANRAKDEFIAHVSHELRTPLNAILGWARLLSAGLDEERAKRAIATIERNADAMTQLIDDLLDVARIISGKMRLEVEPLDVALVIERALDSVKLAADAKGIRFQVMLDSASSPVVGDAGRLQQVIWNLLSNAVKFTPKAGRITVLLRRLHSSVEVVVQDTGQGVAAEKLDHVFEPFWQESRGPTLGGRGLGLGLAISRNLVELHGGTISVESEGEGRGTTFTITLPLATVRPGPRGSRSTHVEHEGAAVGLPQLAGLRVLAVEDEPDARDLVRSVLETAGCVVTTAGSVLEALVAIEREVPDVLVSDIGLPGETGYDLMRRVRALPPERGGLIPAAAITAYARGEERLTALAAGFIIHVAKPVDPKELVMVVAALASHLPRKPSPP
jgi:PAS domain S-box-containing protein